MNRCLASGLCDNSGCSILIATCLPLLCAARLLILAGCEEVPCTHDDYNYGFHTCLRLSTAAFLTFVRGGRRFIVLGKTSSNSLNYGDRRLPGHSTDQMQQCAPSERSLKTRLRWPNGRARLPRAAEACRRPATRYAMFVPACSNSADCKLNLDVQRAKPRRLIVTFASREGNSR